MNLRFAACLLACSAGLLPAQNAQGIAPAWDVRAMLIRLVEQSKTFSTAIGQLKVQEWVNNGASPTYLKQQEAIMTQAGYLRTVTSRLAEDPEKLSLALDALFRLQSMEIFALALAEAASKFQDSPTAQQLNDVVSLNSEAGAKLRQYVMDLSFTKEQEYTVVEKEAHRCQAMLNQPPPLPRPVTKGKK